jgi:hypothetical protein
VLNILPGGSVIVTNNLIVNSSNYLIVGTNAAGPPYANLVVDKNLSSKSSGDFTFKQNARVAVFGSVTDDGSGGTILQVNNGAQVYIDKNLAFTGGSDQINNSNATNPYGLYVNGSTTNTGGGHTTTANEGNKSTLQSSNPGFYGWVASAPGSTLPVTLTSFDAEVVENSVELTWMTSSEKNFDHFEIERSTDGRVFISIGTVQGHGTTTEVHDYLWTDIKPLTDVSYYRLVSVDFDGFTERFKIVRVDINAGKMISIYPNPIVDRKMNLALNFNSTEPTYVQVFDAVGYRRDAFTFDGTEFTKSIDVESGTYFVKISNGLYAKEERIIVR